MTNLTLKLLAALITVESNGNDQAVNFAGQSWGCLQQKSIYIRDVNRIYGTNFSLTDVASSRQIATAIYQLYMRYYATPERLGRQVTAQDIARIHNGGPDGWRKPRTLRYWYKVKQEMERQKSLQG